MGGTFDKTGGDKGGDLTTSKPPVDKGGSFVDKSSASEAFDYSTSLPAANSGAYNVMVGLYLPELAALFAGEF